MRSRPLRRRTRAAAFVAAAVAVLLVTPAHTAVASPSEPALAAGPRFTTDRSLAPLAGSPRRTAQTSQVPAQLAPAATDALRQLPAGQECPSGSKRSGTLIREGFESGTLPESSYTKGWSIVSGSARSGTKSARSIIRAADPSTQPVDPPYWALGLPFVQTPGGRTILRYAVKGNYPQKAAFVSVNAATGWSDPTSTWGTVALDVTDAITPADNRFVDIRFANYPETRATDSQIELDDIEVYTCTGASNTRGDYDGDGIADLLTVDAGGKLQVWPGTGDFHVKTPITAATGWTNVTWIGSSGDLNGDGRADILARTVNGDLVVHYGDGAGGFTTGSQTVGIGWNVINAIIPMGDINGDSLPDFLARDTAGNMRRYWLTGVGSVLTGGTVVGVGFGGFTSLFSMGDFDHDGRFDLTGILGNGDMRVYTTLSTGALWGTGVKIGNGWFFRQVSASGDYNRDGIPDVLAFDNAGNILTYPVLGDGRWGAIVRTGVGFGSFRLIS